MSKPRLVFIHGNDTVSWALAWTPWFKEETKKLGFAGSFVTFPDSKIARASYWLPFLKDDLKVGEADVIVGWSSGAVAAMRYAETNKIRGSVLISPLYTDLDDELEKQSGYFDKPWDWSSIRRNQADICMISGDDDPYIPQEDFDFIAEQLGAKRIKVPGGGHFIERDTFPELLEYVKKTYGRH